MGIFRCKEIVILSRESEARPKAKGLVPCLLLGWVCHYAGEGNCTMKKKITPKGVVTNFAQGAWFYLFSFFPSFRVFVTFQVGLHLKGRELRFYCCNYQINNIIRYYFHLSGLFRPERRQLLSRESEARLKAKGLTQANWRGFGFNSSFLIFHFYLWDARAPCQTCGGWDAISRKCFRVAPIKLVIVFYSKFYISSLIKGIPPSPDNPAEPVHLAYVHNP